MGGEAGERVGWEGRWHGRVGARCGAILSRMQAEWEGDERGHFCAEGGV